MKSLLLLPILLLSNFYVVSQDRPRRAEPGKCYALCTIMIANEVKKEFPVYTGEDHNVKHIERIQIKSSDGWEEEIVIVTDTTLYIEYVQEEFELIEYTEGDKEWREVLCSDRVTPGLVSQISEALEKKGYEPGDEQFALTSVLKNALIRFQQDNGLPVGQLDIETLKALRIRF